jgi:MATE family multidrug resistance protein
MLVPSVLMLVIPQWLCGLIATTPGVIESGVRFLMIAAVFQVVDGIQSVASGALRGAGITRWPMMAHLVSHWLVGLPIGLLLAYGLNWGPIGLWWGLTVGLGAAALSLTWKFYRVSQGSISALQVGWK